MYTGDTSDARKQWPKAKAFTVKMPNQFKGETEIVILEIENADGVKEGVTAAAPKPVSKKKKAAANPAPKADDLFTSVEA